MRWIFVILFCAVLSSTWAAPDPKKYKPEYKDKKALNSSLTNDERKFLREVESKFGIKSDVPNEETNNDKSSNLTSSSKAPFPAVIAIEIVNDTDATIKGKRTIDANLGYGYRTNNGYTYTYFGKQPQEKGKFMIYPYSQEDIQPSQTSSYSPDSEHSGKYSTNVEIQPSRAYELVDVKQEQNHYHARQPVHQNYANTKGLSASSYNANEGRYQTSHNPTFYTTYNGQEFSALSGKFPMVMSNYLVDTSQLLKSAPYQSAGINQDYIRSHGSPVDQRVVPVLVLRIPSSYLKKPTAELYSNLPNKHPASHYINNINLQDLVNNYFKKIGYSFAPQVMTYQNPGLSKTTLHPSVSSVYNRQHYSNPYVHPSYTQDDHSGVQYSGVQPVMAKYPSSYVRPQQYYVPMTQSHYQQPEQQYEYTYQYVPQTDNQPQYYQPQYQTQTEESLTHNEHSAVSQGPSQASVGHAEYGVPQTANHETVESSAEYSVPETEGTPRHPAYSSQFESSPPMTQEYEAPKQQRVEYYQKSAGSVEYERSKGPMYHSSQSTQGHTVPKEALAYYQSQINQEQKYSLDASTAGMPSYYYQQQLRDDSAKDTLVLSENYPDNDHTIATVLPLSYNRDRKPATVQTVSYVTPVPHKYQSPYKVMVPQTVLKSPDTDNEKVSYVNSHPMPSSQEHNPEAEYTLPAHYIPPVSKQKAPSYPRNYHSHPKRNVKVDNNKLQKTHTDTSDNRKKQSSS